MADERPWKDDGPRFVASLQDVTDFQCYKDFFESQKLNEAQAKADEAAEKHQRSAIVFDRKLMEIVHRKVIEREKKPEIKEKPEIKAPLPPPISKRGKKKPVEVEPVVEPKVEKPKKKITKDDYF